ncbi:MAG: hypothetical protein ABI167_06180 [Nitrosospira sp.]
MALRSYTKITTSLNAITKMAEALPDVEKRSVLKEKSDELLKLAKDAQKWVFILDSELRQARLRLEELEKQLIGTSQSTK